jgi:ankyrin repeat protein
VEALIAAGALVECRNSRYYFTNMIDEILTETLCSGKTPLIFSIKKKHPDVARVLIRNGADIFNKDNKRRSSLDLNQIFGTIDPVEIMKLSQIRRYEEVFSPYINSTILKRFSPIVQRRATYT